MAKLDETNNKLVSKVTSENIVLAKSLKEAHLLKFSAKSHMRISWYIMKIRL